MVVSKQRLRYLVLYDVDVVLGEIGDHAPTNSQRRDKVQLRGINLNRAKIVHHPTYDKAILFGFPRQVLFMAFAGQSGHGRWEMLQDRLVKSLFFSLCKGGKEFKLPLTGHSL